MQRQANQTAGVFCVDDGFFRLLEIELAICGVMQVYRLSPGHMPANHCDVWLVDLDDFPYHTLPPPPDGCRLYAWTRQGSPELPDQASARCLHRPFAMTVLEEMLMQDLYGTQAPVFPVWVESRQRQHPPKVAGTSPDLHMTGDGMVYVGDTMVTLTAQEASLFAYLWERRGQVVSKEALCKALGATPTATTNTLEVYICFLRRKLEKPHGRRYITTVRGRGYRLEMDT